MQTLHKSLPRFSALLVGGAMLLNLPAAEAAIVPFTENFNDTDAGANGWVDNARDPATHFNTGGVDDSGFIRTEFNFSDFTANPTFGASLVTARGEANDDASNDAFVGDWIAEGVNHFSGWVRHDAGQDLPFFVRFASSFNFPGALAGGTEAFNVPSGQWTKLAVDISPDGGPWISFEGTDFETVFSSVGNVQFGIDVPESFFEQDVTVAFDVDNPTIMPEPGSLALLAAGGVLLAGRRRRGS